MSIGIIIGNPGVGKTALMTSFAIKHMTELAYEDRYKARKLIEKMNAGGFDLKLPGKHLVFADYHIESFAPRRVSYHVDGYRLGLPNDKHDTLFLPPWSNFFLDEAQKYFNSRMSKYFEDFTSRYYEMHRHPHFNIWMTCQRLGLIDLNLRGIADKIIDVVSLEHKYDKFDNIIKSTWHCFEFDNYASAEKYIECGRPDGTGQKTKYTFEGDIFSHYNSFGCYPLFFKDCYNKQFDMTPSVATGFSLNAIKQFNRQHEYEAPKTYYKKS